MSKVPPVVRAVGMLPSASVMPNCSATEVSMPMMLMSAT